MGLSAKPFRTRGNRRIAMTNNGAEKKNKRSSFHDLRWWQLNNLNEAGELLKEIMPHNG
jgi:hypothetical protein